jgi:hypothetical protein
VRRRRHCACQAGCPAKDGPLCFYALAFTVVLITPDRFIRKRLVGNFRLVGISPLKLRFDPFAFDTLDPLADGVSAVDPILSV